MVRVRSLLALPAVVLFCAGALPAQNSGAAPSTPSLRVQVLDKAPLTLTDEDLQKMPQHTTKLKEHEKETTYSGVSLHDVLVRAGVPEGNQLHGRVLSSYVLATAKDGYQAVFTLTEMDPGFTDDMVLLADRANGAPLTGTQGPYRLIALHDKKPARSVRMLEGIQVVQLRH